MTDQTSADTAERIRRLQERRSESAGSVTSKRSRKHPAAASRILLAGLSVASFFGVVGAMAAAQSATPAAVQPAASTKRPTGATPAARPAPTTAHTQTRAS